jgi:GT2 family glycosyltransferase
VTATSVIVIVFGAEPGLDECLSSVVRQLGSGDELVVVDNGAERLDERLAPYGDVVRLVRPGGNLGFAGGADAGAEAARSSVLVFVNSDLRVRDGALDELCSTVASDPSVMATGCLRLASDPTRINSAGNPVHFTGLAWAGAFGEPADEHASPRPAASASGGFMAVHRSRWDALGGFNADYFMYHEDVELSLRHWMTGGRIVFVPAAVADHDYEFGRNARKMFHLERNRLMTVATVYPSTVLRRVLPVLVPFEAALVVLAITQGWGAQKLQSYWWLLRHAGRVRRRRRAVQRTFSEGEERLTSLLSSSIDPAGFGAVPGLSLLNTLLTAYWRLVR